MPYSRQSWGMRAWKDGAELLRSQLANCSAAQANRNLAVRRTHTRGASFLSPIPLTCPQRP